jgi:hypothetical protein
MQWYEILLVVLYGLLCLDAGYKLGRRHSR